MLVMGCDPFAEQIVMDLRPATYGKIYIRAYAYPPEGPLHISDTGFDEFDCEEASLYYPLADSFGEFIAVLGPEPEDE